MSLGIEILDHFVECMLQILCISYLLNRKIRCNARLIIVVIIYNVLLLIVNNFNASKLCILLIEIIVYLYVITEFKTKIVDGIIVMLLQLLISSAVQVLASYPVIKLIKDSVSAEGLHLVINIFAIILLVGINKIFKLSKLYIQIIKWDMVVTNILVVLFLLFAILYIGYKFEEKMILFSYFISALLICVAVKITLDWNRDRYEIRQKELELHMHEVYGKTFDGMVEKIRIRQHDFKNQMAAIYGMHLTAYNFEELVESQKKYCDYLMEESKFDSILTKCNDKILAGFLYTKFTEWEKRGVNFKFDIVLNDSQCKLPTYDLIKITGILIDNAAEEQLQQECNCDVEFYIRDSDDCVSIKSINRAEYLSMDKIGQLFNKGYSTKGEGRGLGLYEVKKMLERKGEIIARNITVDGFNYIEFEIDIER